MPAYEKKYFHCHFFQPKKLVKIHSVIAETIHIHEHSASDFRIILIRILVTLIWESTNFSSIGWQFNHTASNQVLHAVWDFSGGGGEEEKIVISGPKLRKMLKIVADLKFLKGESSLQHPTGIMYLIE